MLGVRGHIRSWGSQWVKITTVTLTFSVMLAQSYANDGVYWEHVGGHCYCWWCGGCKSRVSDTFRSTRRRVWGS